MFVPGLINCILVLVCFGNFSNILENLTTATTTRIMMGRLNGVAAFTVITIDILAFNGLRVVSFR